MRWGSSVWVALVCAALVGAGVAGAAAGPVVLHAARSAAGALGSSSARPSSASASTRPQALDTAPPPGAPAIPMPAARLAPAGATLDARTVSARLASATVLIDARLPYQSYDSVGTGIVLTSSGLVLTDEHVVKGADDITAQVAGTGHTYQAALVGVDVAEDVALLQLEQASGLATVTLGRASAAAVGDRVAVIGYAKDTGPTTVTGSILGREDSVEVTDDSGQQGTSEEAKTTYGEMLHNSAHTQAGQSGGPLVDSAGRVIGMDQVGGDGDDFDIPIERALSAAREIAAGNASADVLIGAPADLGVVARTATPGSGQPGVSVVRVHPSTPASSLGLRAGDVITAIDGSDIASAIELRQILAHHRPGDRVGVAWTDSSGHGHTVRVTLAAGPAP